MSTSNPNLRGFTLIELLVVIAIIAILAAIIFPVFSSVRENARRTACLSNEKQLGLAFTQYTQDFDELLPSQSCGPAGANKMGWILYSTFGTVGTDPVYDVTQGSIYSYVKSKQLYLCPDDGAGKSAGNSYATNSCLAGANACSVGVDTGKSLAAITSPTQTMLLCEEIDAAGQNSATDDAYFLLGANTLQNRHRGGCNIAFVDGHAKYYSSPDDYALRLTTGDGSLICP